MLALERGHPERKAEATKGEAALLLGNYLWKRIFFVQRGAVDFT